MTGSRYHFLLLLVLFFQPAPSLPVAGHRAETVDRHCSRCKDTGRVPNPFMKEDLLTLEKPVRYCSYVIEKDKTGHGLPWLPCPRCRNTTRGTAQWKTFTEEVKKRMDWLEERRTSTAFLRTRTPLLYIETEHFVITWNIPKIVTEDKKVYRLHEGAHLYALRLEDFYTEFMTTLGLEEREMRKHKHFVYLFEDQKSCLKAAKELTGLNCWNAAKMPGSSANPSILVSWRDKASMKEDRDFHRHLVHHLSHLLNVAFFRMEWMAVDAGWADEGLGHYFEIKKFGTADNSCDEEGEEESFKESDWEVDVRRAVESGEAPSFADLRPKSTTAIHGVEHAIAWSYVDYLMHRNPLGFRTFMKVIKEKKGVRAALQEGYGLNFITFQEGWKEYVLENYRKVPLKAPPSGRGRRRKK